MAQRFLFLIFLLGTAWAGFATVIGTVRGMVHDPQHRPVPDTDVLLKAKTSDYLQKTQTDANGEFHFDAVAPRGICGQRLDCRVRKRSAERDSALRGGARFALSQPP
jgi:hypothetical protein